MRICFTFFLFERRFFSSFSLTFGFLKSESLSSRKKKIYIHNMARVYGLEVIYFSGYYYTHTHSVCIETIFSCVCGGPSRRILWRRKKKKNPLESNRWSIGAYFLHTHTHRETYHRILRLVMFTCRFTV